MCIGVAYMNVYGCGGERISLAVVCVCTWMCVYMDVCVNSKTKMIARTCLKGQRISVDNEIEREAFLDGDIRAFFF